MLGFKQLSIIENYFQSEEHLNKNFVLIIFDQVQNEKQIFIPTIKMAINKDKIDFPLNLKLTNNNLIIEKMNIWGLSPNQKISFYQYPELVLENHIELPYNIRNQFEEFKEQAIQYTFRKNGHKYPLLSYSDDMQICQSKKCHDGIKNNWSKELNIKTMFPKEKKIRVTHYILNRPVAHLLKNAQFHLVPTTEILPKARYFVRNYFSKKTYCPKADYYFSRIEMLKESSQQNYVNLTGLKKTIQPLKNEEKSANSDWFNQVLR
jgi:hypothetical protein